MSINSFSFWWCTCSLHTMAYLLHGDFLFLISLLLENVKEESRYEWKGMIHQDQQPLAAQNMLCFHAAQIMLCLISSTIWVACMYTEMIQRWKWIIHNMNYTHSPTFGVFWLLIFSSCKTKHRIVSKKAYKFCRWSLIWCKTL